MAYTRIHQIKKTLNKALDYIENSKKTNEQTLVSGYNVDPLSASIEFEITAALAREIKGDYSKVGGANILAYHMIQSFSPSDKITPEDAHKLGKKWADEILKGKYEYVISTHVDKEHIHNHIIFNAVSFYDYKKYETVPYKSAALLRKVSDRLCEEQGLTVIRNSKIKQKGTTHYEWTHRKAGTSWKVQIKNIIDKVIDKTSDYDSFKLELKKFNVEIKEGKRISFRIANTEQKRFCRGDRIGENYSKAKILERLKLEKDDKKTFDSFDKKIEWQAQKIKLSDTKELAAALLTIREENIKENSDFEIRVDNLLNEASNVRSTIKELSEKNQQYKKAAKYLLTFNKYYPVKVEFEQQNIFKKNKFANLHESELKIFDYAKKQLEKMSVNTNVDADKVIALVKDQDNKISDLSSKLKSVTEKIKKIRTAQNLVKNIEKETKKASQAKKDKDIQKIGER